jgi:hypothetical protein
MVAVNRRRRERLAWAAVTLTAALAMAAFAAGPAAAQPLHWSPPQLIVPPPVLVNSDDISGVSCSAARLCVAVDSSGHIFSSTDPGGGLAEWRVVTLDAGPAGRQLTGVACTGPGLCVAVTRAGDAISTQSPSGGAGGWKARRIDRAGLSSIACPSQRLCVAVGGGGTVETSSRPRSGSGWRRTRIGHSRLVSVSCASARLCAAFNRAGRVYVNTDPARRGSDWRSAGLKDSALTGISCPSTHLCVAVDDNDNVHVSTKPASRQSRWKGSSIDSNALNAVTCTSARLCTAVDAEGDIMTSHHPTGGAHSWHTVDLERFSGGNLVAVSCVSARQCATVDEGQVLVGTPGAPAHTWSKAPVDAGAPLNGVGCPSAGLCFAAAGTTGRILYSTNPTGGARWSVAETDPASGAGAATVNALSCPTAALCVAVDSKGNVLTSSTPTVGGSWSSAPIDPGGDLSSVSCTASGYCLAVDPAGDVFASGNPTGGAGVWTASPAPAFLQVACASAQLCLGGGSGVLYASASPGAAGSWNQVLTDSAVIRDVGIVQFSFNALACPSTELCLAADSGGTVFASTSPTSPTSWSGRYFDQPADPASGPGIAVNALSCGSTDLCVAVDSDGGALSSTDPGASGSWSRAPMRASASDISCPSAQLCVAVDSLGNAIVGRS